MAPPPGTLRVGRYFLALFVILGVLYTVVFIPGNRHTPKLGIDLVGGIRVIFTAKPPAGASITSTALATSRQIIEDRINGTGVTTSTVQVQGNDQLVVSIPGGTGTDVARLGKAAQLNFRPLIAPVQQVACDPNRKPVTSTPSTAPSAGTSSGATSKPSGSAKPTTNGLNNRPLAAPTTPSGSPKTPASTPAKPPASTPAKTPASTPAASPSATQAAPACLTNPIGELTKADPALKVPTTEKAYAALGKQQQQELGAALQNYDCASTVDEKDDPKSYYIACQNQGTGINTAYLLGTVIVPGRQIDAANAVAPSTGGQGGSTQWTVSLTLKGAGDSAWGNWTTAHNTAKQNADPSQCGLSTQFPCNDFVAFTLDGAVISAPATNEAIVGQATQISGNFTQKSANTLADQLKFGALPLTFRTDSNEHVSASLGTSQLKAALLAGGIGLVLVVLYSLLYYRGLGLVTVASLVVSGVMTYAMMVILATQIGFTLDLSGIAGLIVALGITADSFVVFFERIKDEVHEGRSVRVAVPRAWVRARRTVLSADTVSFLAAAILYYFASADVKGFAFTLGLSTILDLVVVFLFTHPIVSLLSRSRTFGSPRFTGLNSVRVGGIATDEPVARGKGAARRTSGKRAAGRTAVLDRDTETEIEEDEYNEDELDAINATNAVDEASVAVDEDSVVDDDDVADDAEPPPASEPRRRSAPKEGTAAERAAARRARMREQQGRSEDGEGS